MTTRPQKLLDLPLWHGKVTTKPLTGGRSNEAYIASDDKAQYVVRFCHDIDVHHVNRDYEAMVSKAASIAGFAPTLVYYKMTGSEGVMVFDFITAKTYEKPDVGANLSAIIKCLKGFHHQVAKQVHGYARLFNVFNVISDYIATLEKDNSRFSDKLDAYRNISDHLNAAQLPEHIIFAHNDLMPANILESDGKIVLIDFEYAAFSTPLSDLANLASNAGFTPEQDRQMLAEYFGAPASDEQLQALAALKCALMLRETMWSMVSEIHLDVPGVDYELYTSECLEALDQELSAYQSKYGKFAQ